MENRVIAIAIAAAIMLLLFLYLVTTEKPYEAPISEFCGNSMCEGDEDCTICPADCGMCTAECGDGTCQGSEDCKVCPADCGECEMLVATKGSLPDEDNCNYTETGWVCSLDVTEFNMSDYNASNQISNAWQQECIMQGGTYRCYGYCMPRYDHYCHFPYLDSGEKCDSSDDCFGKCVVWVPEFETFYAKYSGEKNCNCSGTCEEFPLSICEWGWVEISDGHATGIGAALCD